MTGGEEETRMNNWNVKKKRRGRTWKGTGRSSAIRSKFHHSQGIVKWKDGGEDGKQQ